MFGLSRQTCESCNEHARQVVIVPCSTRHSVFYGLLACGARAIALAVKAAGGAAIVNVDVVDDDDVG